MKRILGLDLGTNSIGWALVEVQTENNQEKIIKSGSRIIPMSQDVLNKFDSGQSVSQTAERTKYRGIRRLKERQQLRRERLHRVLNILGFLPEHYAKCIDFEKRVGKIKPETEPKIAYRTVNIEGGNKHEFIFKKSFEEMLEVFKETSKTFAEENKLIPYDWTIYYLRKKALKEKIEKEELAWILLNFNQKRGYYQLRGEEEDEPENKIVEYHSLKVIKTELDDSSAKKEEKWYIFHLENGWIYKRSSKTAIDWTGKTKDFIVTTELNEDGSVKKDKDGKEKRTFRAPSEDDWVLEKKKTENEIGKSGKTVGVYIFDTLLEKPNQKIKGKLVRTIERKFYREELEAIINEQAKHHPELQSQHLLASCCEELYEINENHRKSVASKGFVHLFLNDIIFYQRPLKSQKSQISDCKFESVTFVKDGQKQTQRLKCAPKSHPLFQEFRLWQFIQNLKIYKKDTDEDVTAYFLKNTEDWENLFEWLNEKNEIDQKSFLRYPDFNLKKETEKYRWNYVEDKSYPCNTTRHRIIQRLAKSNIDKEFLSKETEEALWHILYSVNDKEELKKALSTFAKKHNLNDEFVEVFKKFPPFESEYGSYSTKALKKMLALMRMGKFWKQEDIHPKTLDRIEKIINGEYDERIRERVREKAYRFTEISEFQNLPVWLASYIVYDRHSEDAENLKWKTPADIEIYLKNVFKQHSLRNPIVEQLISETLRVVADIWKHFGNSSEEYFNEIHLELGREMKNPANKRKNLTEQNTKNENTNLRIKALLMELLNDVDIENVRPYSHSQQEILKIYEDGVLNSVELIPEDILKISKAPQPTKAELNKYKIWLNQKYRSPYTGEMIPLNKLFTPAYEIEHIIPQSRFFDDSFSNKVICEAAVNKDKGNQLAYEYISNEGGKVIEVGEGKKVTLFTKEKYEKHIKETFAKDKNKRKKLLMEEIPTEFVQRQLNDSRYISKFVRNLLSNIVREENEQETVSKHLITTNGTITSVLKQDWGLNEIWNELIAPRFERLNQLTNSNQFGSINPKTGKFLPQVPLEFQKGFNKKRIDHRHHALDAIVIAFTTRDHINYLNNESALEKTSKDSKEKARFDLRNKLCHKKYNEESDTNYKWMFNTPWHSFAKDVKDELESIVVSFKQNLRIINKTVNYYEKLTKDDNGNLRKTKIKQTKGDNWAIRKPLHKETVKGKVQIRSKKTVNLNAAFHQWENIVDIDLRKKIKELLSLNYDQKALQKYFKNFDNVWNGKNISRVDVYVFDEFAASRELLNESFTEEKINEKITSTSIQKILLNHLERYKNQKDDKGKEIPAETLAFSPEGIEEMNKNIKELNDGKAHLPIFKVRTYETVGQKFPVGQQANKHTKLVEAEKGTNLYFAIYQDLEGKRDFATIPFNVVLERLKQGLLPVPEKNENEWPLLMYLSPNDLVKITDSKGNEQIYKMVSSTGNRAYFINSSVSKPVIDKYEFSQLNKIEKTFDGISIKEKCIKLCVDRLGSVVSQNQ